MIVATLVFVLLHGSVAPDDGTYDSMARAVATRHTQSWDAYYHALYVSTRSFTLPLALIYRFLGATRILGQLFSAVIGALTAAFTARLALETLTRRWALLAGLVVACLPSQIVWSSVTLKDGSVWAALAACAVLVAVSSRLTGRRLVLCIAGLVVALVYLSALRGHTLVVACWALLITAIVGSRNRLWNILGATTAVLLPFTLGLGPLGVGLIRHSGSLAERRVDNAQNAATAIVRLPTTTVEAAPTISGGSAATIRGGSAATISGGSAATISGGSAATISGGSAPTTSVLGPEALPAARDDSVSANVAYLPKGLVAVALRPFPWEKSRTTAAALARLEPLVWYPLLVFALIGVGGVWSRRDVLLFPLLTAGGVMLMYALSEGNVGTAYRHRSEAAWAVTLLAVVGLRTVVIRLRSSSGSGHEGD